MWRPPGPIGPPVPGVNPNPRWIGPWNSPPPITNGYVGNYGSPTPPSFGGLGVRNWFGPPGQDNPYLRLQNALRLLNGGMAPPPPRFPSPYGQGGGRGIY